MSELRVAEIHNPNDQTGGITIDNDDNVSINGSPIGNQGALGNRNLIINGAMKIAQRGTEVTGVTTPEYRTCDRFRIDVNSLGTWTVQQDNSEPEGFSSLRMLCTTADAAPAAGDFSAISYRAEGFDCQRLLDTGTTTHPMRLSFWVRSNRTGDASVDLVQADNSNRMFSASYNIAAANTWERKVIEIPADTAAAFGNDNGQGLRINWWLNSGSNFTGGTHSAGWVALDNTARNATNLGVGGTVNDNFAITGVQLEVGTNATAFEWRSHAAELALCQRYCHVWRANNANDSFGPAAVWSSNTRTVIGEYTFPTTMREPPDMVLNATANIIFSANSTDHTVSSFTLNRRTENNAQVFSEQTDQNVAYPNNGVGGFYRDSGTQALRAVVTFDAEL